MDKGDPAPNDHDFIVYQVINKHFRQDVREFWVRSNFYLLVQAGLLSVYVTAGAGQTTTLMDRTTLSVLVLGIVGLGLSIVWFVVARGSVIWIRRWRQQMIELDNVLNKHRCYSTVEQHASNRPFQSPSHVTQYVPIFFAAAWVLLLGITLVHALGYFKTDVPAGAGLPFFE